MVTNGFIHEILVTSMQEINYIIITWNKWLYFLFVESKCFINILNFCFNPPIPHSTLILYHVCILLYVYTTSKSQHGQVHTSQAITSQTFFHPYNLGHSINIHKTHFNVKKLDANFGINLTHTRCSSHGRKQ
jgi:hypothetical protein